MDWAEALDIVVDRTGHERYRVLTADDHPDHPAWRARMVERATGEPPTPAEYPSLGRQALNLAGAVGRVVAAAVTGGPIRVPAEVLEARRALCLACPHNGERAAGGIRCTECGCGGLKLELATERCPVGKWEAIPH